MKIKLTYLLSAFVLAACSDSENRSHATVMTFAELNAKCQIGQNISECDALHDAPIRIEGILSFSSLSENQSVLHPGHIVEFDEEKEEHWFSSIQIMGTTDERESLKKFDKKYVIAEGLIDTSCVKKHTEIDAFNNKSLESGNDEIILRMATGPCHYINNRAFFAPEIIIKDE